MHSLTHSDIKTLWGLFSDLIDRWRRPAGPLQEILTALRDSEELEEELRDAVIWLTKALLKAKDRSPSRVAFLFTSAGARAVRRLTFRKFARSKRAATGR